jgi:DNA-binding GntR family transcriptional regulator
VADLPDVGGPEAKRPVLPSVRCEQELRRRLAAGVFGPKGTQLPGMDVLAAELDCSRGTVASVLRKLAAEGLVAVIRSYGSFVALAPAD